MSMEIDGTFLGQVIRSDATVSHVFRQNEQWCVGPVGGCGWNCHPKR